MKNDFECNAEITVPTRERSRIDLFFLSLLAIGHAITDSYGQSLLSPMLPHIARRLNLSLTQIGALPMMMGFSSSLSQPIFGQLADQKPRWCMVAVGPFLASCFIGFVGYARGYWELAALLFLVGIGISAFHPQGATLARKVGRGSGFSMGVFSVGGNVGFGLAPLLGGFYLVRLGLDRLYLSAMPALVFAGIMTLVFYSRIHDQCVGKLRQSGLSKIEGDSSRTAFVALAATVVIRSTVQIGLMTFLPFLIQQRFPVSQQVEIQSLAVSALLLSGAFAAPIGGHLSDRFGRRPLIFWSFCLAPWPLLIACHLPAVNLLVLLAMGGLILMLPHPGTVVMAQELMPQRSGIAVSLITGVAWGIAQILVLPLGKVAELTSLSAALSGLCLLPVLGVFLVLLVPEHIPAAN